MGLDNNNYKNSEVILRFHDELSIQLRKMAYFGSSTKEMVEVYESWITDLKRQLKQEEKGK